MGCGLHSWAWILLSLDLLTKIAYYFHRLCMILLPQAVIGKCKTVFKLFMYTLLKKIYFQTQLTNFMFCQTIFNFVVSTYRIVHVFKNTCT